MTNWLCKRTPGTVSVFGNGSFDLPQLQGDPVSISLDQWRIEEAFRRGANSVEIFFRLIKSQGSPCDPGAPASPPSPLLDKGMLATDSQLDFNNFLLSLVTVIEMTYRDTIRQEFEGLPKDVQQAFAFEGASPFDHYLRIRPAYYNAGYDNPAATIFSKIQQTRLVGRNVVSPGLHEVLVKKLPAVDNLLNQWQPGLANDMGKLIRSVGGFVPRYIAPRQGQKYPPVLSNHALGLAFDIDPSSNPHIKDKDVIKILNEIAKDAGIDYGSFIVEHAAGVPDEDWASQMHQKAGRASNLVKAWLSKYLPVYEKLQDRLKQEQTIAKTANPKQKTALLDKLATGSQPATPALAPDEQEAVEKIKILVKYHALSEVKKWASQGIQTIPLILAVALVKAGLRWGQSYRDTKDAMHFELVDDKGRAMVYPESKPRSWQDLFESNAPPAAKPSPKPKKH